MPEHELSLGEYDGGSLGAWKYGSWLLQIGSGPEGGYKFKFEVACKVGGRDIDVTKLKAAVDGDLKDLILQALEESVVVVAEEEASVDTEQMSSLE